MDETTKSELEKILHKFEDKAKIRSKKDAQKNQEEERYRMGFSRVVKEVIRPTMEEIETFIKKQGHECHIIESDASIMMDIIPASLHRFAPDQPSIAFFNSPKSASIRMSKRPLQYTYVKSSIQDYIDLKIEDITRDLVEQNILDIMKTCENKTFKGQQDTPYRENTGLCQRIDLQYGYGKTLKRKRFIEDSLIASTIVLAAVIAEFKFLMIAKVIIRRRQKDYGHKLEKSIRS